MDSDSIYLTFLILTGILSVVLPKIIQNVENSNRKEKLDDEQLSLGKTIKASFTADCPSHAERFIIDGGRCLICCINAKRKTITFIPFGKIIKVELKQDAETIYSKSVVNGAAIGGALFGGVGAVVGAMGGDTKQKVKARYLCVKLTLRDLNSPTYEIECYKGEPSDELKEEMQFAESVIDRLNVILDLVSNGQISPDGQIQIKRFKSE